MAAGQSRDRGAKDGRVGLGDDQGTRVGRPDPSPTAAAEGDTTKTGSGPSGMGSEASEGVHGAGGRSEADKSGVVADRTEGTKGRKGSEPLDGASNKHRSGYGGSGGKPVTSSDQREPNKPKR